MDLTLVSAYHDGESSTALCDNLVAIEGVSASTVTAHAYDRTVGWEATHRLARLIARHGCVTYIGNANRRGNVGHGEVLSFVDLAIDLVYCIRQKSGAGRQLEKRGRWSPRRTVREELMTKTRQSTMMDNEGKAG